MRRKIIVALLAILVVCALSLTISACKTDCAKTGEHTWDDGVVTTAAKCDAEGVKTYHCTVCNAEKTEKIDKIPHTPATDAAQPASCISGGKTEGSHCSVCGETITAQTDTNALGHKWVEDKVVREATCVADGLRLLKCSNNCGETKEEAIPKISEHSWDDGEETVEATCNSKGEILYSCTVDGCNETRTEETPIDPDNHGNAEFEWKIRGTNNEHRLICSDCGVATERHPANWGDEKVTNATCDKDGAKVRECADCTLKQTTVIPATGHDWNEDSWTKDGTGHWRVCSTCGAKGEVVAHTWSWVALTGDNAGKHRQVCSVCEFVKPNTTVDHEWETKAITEGDNAGKHHDVCKYCKTEDAESVVDHTYTCAAIKGNATQHHSICEACGNVQADSVADHDWIYVNLPGDNDDHHQVCKDCGTEKKDSVDGHDWEVINTDENEHWNECSLCHLISSKTAHSFDVYGTDATGHWELCECGKVLSAKQPHDDSMSDTLVCDTCNYTVSEKVVVLIDGVATYQEADTLPQAISMIAASDSKKGKVIMGADYSGAGVEVPQGVEVEIRLNSHTYTINGALVGDSAGLSFAKGSTVTLVNGTVVMANAEAKTLIDNAANLTMRNVKMNGSAMVLDNGTILNITNGTVNVRGNEYIPASATTIEGFAALRIMYTDEGNTINVTVGQVATRHGGAIIYGTTLDDVDLTGKCTLSLPEGYSVEFVGVECDNADVTRNGVKLVHRWEDHVVVTEATCYTDGEEMYECARCSAIDVRTIPATGKHNWDAGEVTTDPTCMTKGVRTRTCQTDGCTATTTVEIAIDPDAHRFSDVWTNEDGKHWHACLNTNAGGDQCEARDSEHNENFADAWTTDNNKHWHVCTGADCTITSVAENHTVTYEYYINGLHRGTCSVCEKELQVDCDTNGADKACSVCGNVRTETTLATLAFPLESGKSSSYTATFEAVPTGSDNTWTITGFNTNNNSWSVFKAGRNGSASVASISVKLDGIVSGIKLNLTKIADTSKVNSITLYVSKNASDYTTNYIEKIDCDIETGEKAYAITNPARELYYTFVFDLQALSNGFVELTSITYTGYALEHDLNDGEVIKQPTCTEEGQLKRTCNLCGTEVIEAIPVHHELVKHEATDPSCVTKTNGTITYWQCTSTCGKYFADADATSELTASQTVVPYTHGTLEHHNAVPAKVGEDGCKEYWECPDCHTLFVDKDGKVETTMAALTIPALTEVCAHEHCYLVISNGKHTFMCSDCQNVAATENCEGTLAYTSNNNGTHDIMCETCNGIALNEACSYEDGATNCKHCNYKGYVIITLSVTGADAAEILELTLDDDDEALTISDINTVRIPVGHNVSVTINSANLSGKVTEIKLGEKTISATSTAFDTGNLDDNVTLTIKIANDIVIQFGSDYNEKSISSYDNSWQVKRNSTDTTYFATLTNFNNSNNQWSYVRAGAKQTTNGTASITTNNNLTNKISKVTLTVSGTKYVKSHITSIILEVLDNTTVVETVTGTLPASVASGSTADIDFAITTPRANCKYKITITYTNSTKTNGSIDISKVTYAG